MRVLLAILIFLPLFAIAQERSQQNQISCTTSKLVSDAGYTVFVYKDKKGNTQGSIRPVQAWAANPALAEGQVDINFVPVKTGCDLLISWGDTKLVGSANKGIFSARILSKNDAAIGMPTHVKCNLEGIEMQKKYDLCVGNKDSKASPEKAPDLKDPTQPTREEKLESAVDIAS